MNNYIIILNNYSFIYGSDMSKPSKKFIPNAVNYILSALGAISIALQNYVAVELFIRVTMLAGAPLTIGASRLLRLISFVFGAVGSGMVNFFINIDLLDAFFKRLSGETPSPSLTGWVQVQYVLGIIVFIATGLLFGLTAFAFAITTPFALLAISAGIFVAIIMTIQELETWLQSFDDQSTETIEFSIGALCGHIIAAGNVLGLSLLFTLGLAETLMFFNVAAFPALMVGLCVAFSGGAFTEFYFYNFFLAKFCNSFDQKCELMKNTKYAFFGLFCISCNALVNMALTYSGVGLLSLFLVTAGIALPPTWAFIGLSAVSGAFAGAASFLLGMDFWIRNMSPCDESLATPKIDIREHSPSTFSEPSISHSPSLSFSSGTSNGIRFFRPINDEIATVCEKAVSLVGSKTPGAS